MSERTTSLIIALVTLFEAFLHHLVSVVNRAVVAEQQRSLDLEAEIAALRARVAELEAQAAPVESYPC